MPLRNPGPNELRCIARDTLGHYRGLIVGGVYQLRGLGKVDPYSIDTYVPSVKHCIDEHPALSLTIGKDAAGSTTWIRLQELDIRNHIQILKLVDLHTENIDASEDVVFKRSLSILHGEPFSLDVMTPRWKVVVVPMPSTEDLALRRCFISVVYSHSIGDGMSGLAFHGTFLKALKDTVDSNAQGPMEYVYPTSEKPLPFQLDQPDCLPISWSYLLAPLLGEYLPKLAGFLRLPSEFSIDIDSTWTGALSFYKPEGHRTAIDIFSLDGSTVLSALKACRSHDAKLTALLHQFIVNALSKVLPGSISSQKQIIISQTAINLRALVGVSNNEMGLYASRVNQTHAIDISREQESITDLNDPGLWSSARDLTAKLAQGSSTLKDQATGLLRYITDTQAWTERKIGKPRDASYELSNILAFDPKNDPSSSSNDATKPGWSLQKLLFSQPANATGSPLAFNIVSVKDGDLVCVVSWQVGALGLKSDGDGVKSDEEMEKTFVRRVCELITRDFKNIVEQNSRGSV